jgi:hypothetical protein
LNEKFSVACVCDDRGCPSPILSAGFISTEIQQFDENSVIFDFFGFFSTEFEPFYKFLPKWK